MFCTSRFLYCTVLLVAGLYTFGDSPSACFFVKADGEIANAIIRNEYKRLSGEIGKNLGATLPIAAFEARNLLHDAAFIRSANAREILLENLGYSRHVANSDATNNMAFAFGSVMGASTSSMEGMFPAYYALGRIGLTSGHWFRIAEYYPKSAGRDVVLYSLGRIAFGLPYLEHLIRSEIDGGNTNFVGLAIQRSHYPFGDPSSIHFSSPFAGYLYRKMEQALVRQFSTELGNASANLPDTIATMGFIRSLEAVPILSEHLTVCPQIATNAPGGYLFPAAEALIEIGPAIGYCFGRLDAAKPLSVEESLWLRISHELYPEGLEYDLLRRSGTNDLRAVRLLGALPWRRLDDDCEPIETLRLQGDASFW